MMSKNAYDTRSFLFVDNEFEDIGTAVMAGSVEFHMAQSDLSHVEIGVDEGFLVPNGLGEIMTAGIPIKTGPSSACSFTLKPSYRSTAAT